MSIRPEFEPIHLTPQGEALVAIIREEYSTLLSKLDAILKQPSRPKSVVVTKLQEACMWTVRVICETPEYNEKTLPPFTPTVGVIPGNIK